MSRIRFEDWVSEFSLETQQAIQDGGEDLIARYDDEVERTVTAKRLHKQCQDAFSHLVVACYKMGMYLNVCNDKLGYEGLLHVIEESNISEDNARAFLQLWEICISNPEIRDWVEFSDRGGGLAAWEASRFFLDFASIMKSQLSGTEYDEAVSEMLP